MSQSLFLLTHRVDAQKSAGWPGASDRRRFLVPLLIGMVALAGCQARKYELEMTPREGQLERKLTVFEQRKDGEKWVDVPVEDGELARIAAQYGVDVPKSGGPRHSFLQKFAGRLPDDVGGYGTYTRWSTSLGTATAYVERVRGDDDIAGDLDQRRAAVQRLVALLIGWLEKELAATPEWPNLRGFLDGEFRRDLVNLSIYIKSLELVAAHDRLHSAADRDDASGIQAGLCLRMAQYFVERGYLTPSQLPDWIYAVDQAMQERPGPLIAMTQRWLASRIGVPADQPVPASLARLNDTASLRASLRSYLQASDAEPTNSSVHRSLPDILFALWVEPAAEKQIEHFGKVVLNDEELVQYCLWRCGLPEEKAPLWEAFLGGLKPGADLVERINGFRFADESKDAKTPIAYRQIREILVKGLK
jgi:hypothetical protein